MIRLALIAALAGSALGAAVVLADGSEPVRPVAVAAQASPTPPATSRPGRRITARDVRIALEVPDPDGGPPWAVQRASATVERSDVPRECVRLGRLSGGRLGWIDAQGRFTPAADGPGECYTASQMRQIVATSQRSTIVTLSPGGAPRPRVTVTWGLTDDGVRTVRPDGEPAVAVTDRAFLRVERGEGPNAWPTGRAEYAGGRRRTFNPAPRPRFPRREREVPGSDRVVVRAPDPAGGLPWAMIAWRGSRGSVCLAGPGRLVGTRLGSLDRDAGTFHASPFDSIPACPLHEPTRGYPIRIATSVWGAGLGDDPRGRVERRVESTRVIFSGRVHRDVASVTIRTPRDVRTLVPSADAHVILTVYEGRFPAGQATATARMKDGREVTRTLYVE